MIPPMAELPQGTITLLFTDVDHSTELVKRLENRYVEVLARHRELLRIAFASHYGTEVDTQGDAFFVAFERARDAVEAAIAGQRALAEQPWPDEAPLKVRMGLHTGNPYGAEGGYAGVAVHRAARICTIAHGGQVLLSRATAGIVDDEEVGGLGLRDLGEHRLKDFDRPERVYQLVVEGLPSDFPPLRSIDQQTALSGTVTIVGVEGRRMMRLIHELSSDDFGALLTAYQRLVSEVLEQSGGRQVDIAGDSVAAAFVSPRQAVFAAAAVHRAISEHVWPKGQRPEVSIGLHSGEAAIGWLGRAALRCAELCDAAEGGQTFLSPVTAGLLEGDDLGELSLRDVGEARRRRGGELVRAYELVDSRVSP
jgi:class 3 adenylate cyclase